MQSIGDNSDTNNIIENLSPRRFTLLYPESNNYNAGLNTFLNNNDNSTNIQNSNDQNSNNQSN